MQCEENTNDSVTRSSGCNTMNSPYRYNLHSFLTNVRMKTTMIVQMSMEVSHKDMILLNYLSHTYHPDTVDNIHPVIVVMDFGK